MAYRVYGKEIGGKGKFRPLAVGEGFVTNLIHATLYTYYIEAMTVASEYSADNSGYTFEVREAK